jgi:hypothetical protein
MTLASFRGTIAFLVHAARWRRWWWWLVVLATGCASLSQVQPADTLGAGRLQVAVAPAVSAPAAEPGRLSPVFDVAVRYGAHERLDVGASLGQSGLVLSGKVLLTPRQWALLVSVAPFVGANLVLGGEPLRATATQYTLGAPLLVGLRLGAHQLVLGARVQLLAERPVDGAVTSQTWAWGGSAGVVARLSRAVAVMPELAAVVPFAGPGGPVAQLRLGFLLGEPAAP